MISRIARAILWVTIVFLLGLGIGMANPSTGRTPLPKGKQVSQCDFVHWDSNHLGNMAAPVDLNRDGFIDCNSDYELGS